MKRPSVTDVLVTGLAPAVWGSTFIVTTQLLPDGRPLLAGVVRALPAGVLLVIVTRTTLRGAWWWKAAVLGSFNIGLFFYFLFLAAYQLPGGMAALVLSLQTILVLLFGRMLLSQRIRLVQMGACVAGVAGVGLLTLEPDAAITPLGLGAGVAGAASLALGIVLTKRWGRPPGASLLGFTGVQLTAGGLLLLPFALAIEGAPPVLTMRNLAGFGYLTVVGAVLAYVVWFRGLERMPASVASFLGLVSPLVATLLGVAFLHETFSPEQLIGASLLVASVVVVQRTSEA